MTPHQRMLAAIAGKPVDRFPFSTYNCHPFAWGSHRDAAGYGPILEKIEATSVSCLCKVSARALRETSDFETRHRVEGTDTYTTVTWRTPLGPLTRITRKPADQPGMCAKHFIEDARDVERYLSVPYVPVRWDASTAVAQLREIGEKGIAYLSYRDPFYDVSDLFDQADFTIRTVEEFDFIRSLVEFRFEQVFPDLKLLLEALTPSRAPFLLYSAGPERATPPLFSPDIFRRLVLPYQRQLVSLIHDFGYPVSLHCHGRVREVLPYVLECGFDVLEPIEPPPQGNIDLDGLRRAAGGRIALMGYIQDQDFYLLAEEGMRGKVRDIAALIGQDTGYICCPTATPFQHPPTPTFVQNYIAFLDEAEAVGRS